MILSKTNFSLNKIKNTECGIKKSILSSGSENEEEPLDVSITLDLKNGTVEVWDQDFEFLTNTTILPSTYSYESHGRYTINTSIKKEDNYGLKLSQITDISGALSINEFENPDKVLQELENFRLNVAGSEEDYYYKIKNKNGTIEIVSYNTFKQELELIAENFNNPASQDRTRQP